MKLFAAPDKPGGGPVDPENGENGLKGVYFESVYDLKKNLVPWMRSKRLERLSVYAYQGTTDSEIGHFIVTREYNSLTCTDADGTRVTLFGGGRSASGAARGISRQRGTRSMRIEQWLSQKGYRTSSVTFDVYEYEEGDEEITQQEQQHEAEAGEQPAQMTEHAIMPADAQPELEEEPAPVAVEHAEEAVEQVRPGQQKIKGPRKPRRKKPIKAEKKAKRMEAAREAYGSMVRDAASIIHSISSTDKESTSRAMVRMHDFADFLNANPEYKALFIRQLDRADMIEIKTFLSMFRLDRSGLSRSAQVSSSFKYLRKLAAEVHKESVHDDPYRSHAALHWRYHTDREVHEYLDLFPDVPQFMFISYLHSLPAQRWLDIGSGETYRVPDSLMNAMPSINPRVRIAGLDPLYDERTAAPVDKAQGRHKLDPLWAAKNELIAGTAQNMPVDSNSIDQILSFYAFDKFNEAAEGTTQAMRQMARVLVPGGIARIYGMHRSELAEGKPVHRYFQIPVRADYETDQPTGADLSMVVLVRKKLAPSEEATIQKEINEWLGRYAASGSTGK